MEGWYKRVVHGKGSLWVHDSTINYHFADFDVYISYYGMNKQDASHINNYMTVWHGITGATITDAKKLYDYYLGHKDIEGAFYEKLSEEINSRANHFGFKSGTIPSVKFNGLLLDVFVPSLPVSDFNIIRAAVEDQGRFINSLPQTILEDIKNKVVEEIEETVET